jgi:hypothetical protein
MRNRRSDVWAVGLRGTLLVVIGAVLVWIFRRASTEHDVSEPGVTL